MSDDVPSEPQTVEQTGSQTKVVGTDSKEIVELTQAGYTLPKAPIVTLSQITNTGRVTLTFSEDMSPIPDDQLALIKTSTVTDLSSVTRPVIELHVKHN